MNLLLSALQLIPYPVGLLRDRPETTYQIIERGCDLPESMVLGERSTRRVVAVGNSDVSCQNLLDANLQLLALLGIGMLQSRYLFSAIGPYDLPMRSLDPEIRDHRHDEEEGYRASEQSHAAIEFFVGDYVG